MDIGLYIGQFLVRQQYCSLPGLGVFELRKLPAGMKQAEGQIAPPRYQISFSPVGSIDDAFASFIANHENVSINNATNHIKEFCSAVKKQLSEQGHVALPALGRLTQQGGRIAFEQSADLDLGLDAVAVPAVEQRPAAETTPAAKLDFSYPPPPRRRGTSGIFRPVAIVIVILALAGIVYFGVSSINKTSTETPSEPAPAEAVAAPAPAPETPGVWKVVVFTYNSEAGAKTKADKLNRYGNKATVAPLDSTRFVVILEATHPQGDTTRLVDSLRKFFNPKGPVYILR